MPVLEATPEIAEQAKGTIDPSADPQSRNQGVGSDVAPAHAETSLDMTAEQAIKVCPYLGKLALEDPELAQQKAEEYISDPEKMIQIHPDHESDEEETDDGFWDDLEAEFAMEETADEVTEAEQPELSEAIVSDPPEEADPYPNVITEPPEPPMAQFDRENALSQQEIQNRQHHDKKSKTRSKLVESSESSNHVVNIEVIVSQVISANPQACKAFKNGDSGALDILVSEAMRLSKAHK